MNTINLLIYLKKKTGIETKCTIIDSFKKQISTVSLKMVKLSICRHSHPLWSFITAYTCLHVELVAACRPDVEYDLCSPAPLVPTRSM